MLPNPFEARRLPVAAQGLGSCWSQVIPVRMLAEEPWAESEGLSTEAVTQGPFGQGVPGHGFPHATMGKLYIGIPVFDHRKSNRANRSEPKWAVTPRVPH